MDKETFVAMLDETNRLLLRELHANPRITMSALGRIVGMSAPAVTERVQRMERDGVITGYRVEVDPAALGLPVSAFTRVRPAPRVEARAFASLACGPSHRRCDGCAFPNPASSTCHPSASIE